MRWWDMKAFEVLLTPVLFRNKIQPRLILSKFSEQPAQHGSSLLSQHTALWQLPFPGCRSLCPWAFLTFGPLTSASWQRQETRALCSAQPHGPGGPQEMLGLRREAARVAWGREPHRVLPLSCALLALIWGAACHVDGFPRAKPPLRSQKKPICTVHIIQSAIYSLKEFVPFDLMCPTCNEMIVMFKFVFPKDIFLNSRT